MASADRRSNSMNALVSTLKTTRATRSATRHLRQRGGVDVPHERARDGRTEMHRHRPLQDATHGTHAAPPSVTSPTTGGTGPDAGDAGDDPDDPGAGRPSAPKNAARNRSRCSPSSASASNPAPTAVTT